MMQPHTHPRGDEVVHGITGARLAHLGALQQCLLRCVSCQLFVWASAQLLLALAKQVTQTEPDASLVARCDSGNVLVYKPGAQGQPWTAARASAHPDTQRLRLAEALFDTWMRLAGRTQVSVVNEAVAGHGVNQVELRTMDVSFVPQGVATAEHTTA